MSNQTKAYIAGIGMITPLGFNSAMTSASVGAGISSYEISDHYHNHAGEPITLSLAPDELFTNPFEIDEGDYYSVQYDRIIKLSILALRDIFSQQSVERPVPLILTMAESQVGVVPVLSKLLIQNLLSQPDLLIAQNSVRPTYTGRAGGIEGLDLAFRYLYDADEDYVLVGGSDSHLSAARLNRLDEQRRLLAPGSADGFAPGEGGAFILLTRHPACALCRHGQIIALSPPGIANEPGHLFSDEPYKGEGLDKAFKKALKGYTGGAISTVYSSMNGEHYWAKEYGVAIIRNAPHFHEKVKVEHPADCYGDLGSASGSALIGLAAERLFRQTDAACLIYGSSDNGWRAATLMETVAYQSNTPPRSLSPPRVGLRLARDRERGGVGTSDSVESMPQRHPPQRREKVTQIGESVYTPPEGPGEQNDGKIHLNIRIHVYNDGTSNNRTNTQSRLDKKEAYLKLETKKESYENDFTNIATMESYILGDPTPGYHYTLSVYVEGPGTIDDEADRTLGYGIGVGEAGVRSKVERGLTKIVEKIVDALKKAYKKDKEVVIDLLTLDLFGFSRGAAVARSMIHEALSGRQPLQARLAAKEYATTKVEICFVGLYDTVASHGLLFSNDTRALKLDAIYRAKAVLHLVAADEHRKNFSLTNIHSASNGREIFLPGAHSDIGGSYLDNLTEQQVVYEGVAEIAGQERAQLIAAGWYHPHEITLEPLADVVVGEHVLPQARLRVCRPQSAYVGRDTLAPLILGDPPFAPDPYLSPPPLPGIPNGYCRIPLHIMARAAREMGIVFNDKKFNENSAIPDPLIQIAERIDRYLAQTQNGASCAEDWHHNEPWLCELRHRYLHFSARIELGLGPRFSHGKRQRMTYDG